MFFFTFEATPDPEGEFATTDGGAYVNCWINFKRSDGAEVLARYFIEEAGWIPGEITQNLIVHRENYVDDPETLRYFLEAEEDGLCLVFYRWTNEDSDDDVGRTSSQTFEA